MTSRLQELLESIKPNMTEEEIDSILDEYLPEPEFEDSGARRGRRTGSRRRRSARRRLTYDSTPAEENMLNEMPQEQQQAVRSFLSRNGITLRVFVRNIMIPFMLAMMAHRNNLRVDNVMETMYIITLLVRLISNTMGVVHETYTEARNYWQSNIEREQRQRLEQETLRQLTGQPIGSQTWGGQRPINANSSDGQNPEETRSTFIMRNFWMDSNVIRDGIGMLITNRDNIISRVATVNVRDGDFKALVIPIREVEQGADKPIRCQAMIRQDDGSYRRCHQTINIRYTNKGGRFICFCGVHQSWARDSSKRSVNNWKVDENGDNQLSAMEVNNSSRSVESDKNNLKF